MEEEKTQTKMEEIEENKSKENIPSSNKESKITNKEDSLNNQMDDLYKQHKKDIQNNQRPSSKYCRERIDSKKSEDEEEPKEVDEKKLIQKINEHFAQRQITKKEFSDNQNVFLPIDEVRELFKNIHLNLSQEEIEYLFSNKNPNKDDGYIYFNTFLENYEFDFYPGESTLINKSNTDQNKI